MNLLESANAIIAQQADEMKRLSDEIDRLRAALIPFTKVAEAYDKNQLDECRPEWENGDDSSHKILIGRSGQCLLILADFQRAEDALLHST